MSRMLQTLKDLTPLNRVICSSDYDRTIEYLRQLLPFRVIEYPSSVEHNGWVIPPKWDVTEAKILREGKVVYDALLHPLRVIALSTSFRGTIGLDELRRHVHFDARYDDAVTFHFRQQFRPWARDWGFCMPKRTFDWFEPGEYDVIIETRESPGVLKILEYTHPGSLEETIAFGGNLDHPGVANDGLAGCVVGIELLRRLCDRTTKYTYKLVLVQGIIGSEYYLAHLPLTEKAALLECVFLEMLGSRTPLALQFSRNQQANIERVLQRTLSDTGIQHRVGSFESIIINDEYIWENHGIPTVSLSRFPYPEYHSDKDNLEIISEASLDEVVEALGRSVDEMEKSPLVRKQFQGNICLSNPRYDLYIDPGQVAIGDIPDDTRRKMRYLMDLIPSLSRPVTVANLAATVGLPENAVLSYVHRWADKGLVDLL
jgi:aminopeptidase-like protein